MDENKKAAQKKKVSHFITIAVLVILFLAFIFPFIMVIFNAFKTKGDITADPLALVGSHGIYSDQLYRCHEKDELCNILYKLSFDYYSFYDLYNYAFCNDSVCNRS